MQGRSEARTYISSFRQESEARSELSRQAKLYLATYLNYIQNEVYRGNNTKTDSGEIHSKTSRYTVMRNHIKNIQARKKCGRMEHSRRGDKTSFLQKLNKDKN